MKTNWKLTIHEDNVVVVNESDLPILEQVPEDETYNDDKGALEYRSEGNKWLRAEWMDEVKKALSTKALKVTNVIGAFGCADGNPALLYGIGKNVENGFFTIRMGKGQLYDIPEGWEVKINLGPSMDHGEVCTDDLEQTATLVRSAPVEATAVEKQDDLWREVASMVWGKAMVDSALQTKEFQAIKSKYTLTRKV